RRGSLPLLTTLDWALIESWREAGVPLEAVLRGIDSTFDKRETSKAGTRSRRVNGLAWCAQAVMEEAEAIEQASVGSMKAGEAGSSSSAGFEPDRIAAHLGACASSLRDAKVSEEAGALVQATSARLDELAAAVPAGGVDLEELERTLTVLESKLLSILLATEPEAGLLELRAQAGRELAPYRSRMQPLQMRQIEQQFLHKRLLDKYTLPRLSLFYMSQT
ncbi:MAG TPA: hypothetical protein VGD62_07700, partial [Acidobacteriaceae bacterium]